MTTTRPDTAGATSLGSAAVSALSRRLAVVEETLDGGARSAAAADGSVLSTLLRLVDRIRESRDVSHAWLLTVGLTAAMPEQELVRTVSRSIELLASEECVIWLLHAVTPLAMDAGAAEAELRVVTDRPLVDVDFTATSDFLTGIQRVTRAVMAEWHQHHEMEPVAWTGRGGAYRPLNERERDRLLQQEAVEFVPRAGRRRAAVHEIVVPWGVPLVLVEVPFPARSSRLAALAELTGCSLRVVGYDCIPVSSAETVSLEEPEKFGVFLEAVKHADRLAAISRTAADEFEGFVQALTAQGLTGPRVESCPLPDTVPVAGGSGEWGEQLRPLVLTIGSVGRRKNQVALVEAAELLWREDLDFELLLLGHLGGEPSPLHGLVPELQRSGRPLVIERGVSDQRIADALAHARCLVFPSLHEGFGLPVAEALSAGVPVVASDFGSVREIAEGKGGLLVDPEDVTALADALRTVLTDDGVHARLVEEARQRPVRTWTEYAAELWEALLA